MMALLPPADDRRLLYLGLASAVVLWTASIALAF
jgi:hypothetical protein